MLTFVCWKWRRGATGHQLPAAIPEYTAEHVNVLQRMLARHVRMPHRLVCMTDDPAGIECETLPVPTKYAELGGCYRRLWLFSEEAGDVLGERYVSIDLDCVLVDDCTTLFERDEPFVMNAYMPCSRRDPDQFYNGGLMMLTAGSRPEVWQAFDPQRTPALLAEKRREGVCIGTDQAWIRVLLGKSEARWGAQDGIVEARMTRCGLPPGTRLVMYAGRRDPSCDGRDWVTENWW